MKHNTTLPLLILSILSNACSTGVRDNISCLFDVQPSEQLDAVDDTLASVGDSLLQGYADLNQAPVFDDFVTEADADMVVCSYDGLKDALQKAEDDTVIWVPGACDIDFTGKPALTIDKRIVLASSRVEGTSDGALIHTEAKDTFPMFYVKADDVRVTGFEVRGVDGEIGESAYGTPLSMGFEVTARTSEFDNNEFYDLSYTAIRLDNRFVEKTSHYIHHNHIHDIRRTGFGYGVSLRDAEATIEGNYFERTRHAIAGTGEPKTSYEAMYNTVAEGQTGHAFDMHRMGEDPKYKEELGAGRVILIHHNNFLDPVQPAVYIRGIVGEKAEIHHNVIVGDTGSKINLYSEKNVSIYKNIWIWD